MVCRVLHASAGWKPAWACWGIDVHERQVRFLYATRCTSFVKCHCCYCARYRSIEQGTTLSGSRVAFYITKVPII